MVRTAFITVGVLVTVALATGPSTQAADGVISGTIKVAGAASSADVVVYVEQAAGAFTPSKSVTMDQKGMQFLPRVLPVVVGTSVKFLNSDPTPHNVFSPDGEKYNLGTWPTGQSKDYAYAKCAKYPCVYTQLCRVHPEMLGYVVVLQNPYFAVSNRAGEYKIENVPPGSYTVMVWHPRAKAAAQPVTVAAGKPATADFSLAR
jgi:plastocyanin